MTARRRDAPWRGLAASLTLVLTGCANPRAGGDACVQIEGYPVRVFPPGGVMQLLAYGSVNVEVLSRRLATGGIAAQPAPGRP